MAKAGTRQVDIPHLDIPESLWSSQPAVVKELMVTYLDKLSGMKKPLLSDCVRNTVDRMFAAPTVRLYFSDELESLLFNSGSPYRNDALYLVFLKEFLASGRMPEDEKSRYRFQMENVSKNMPGHKAADFEFMVKDRGRFKMSDVQSDYLVLFFYNPDCMRCRDVEQRMQTDSVLASPHVKVLAVYPGIQTQEWLDSPSALPGSWIDGCSPDGVVNNRLLYFIQSTPSIYLLDKHKNVILKDVSFKRLHDYLKEKLM